MKNKEDGYWLDCDYVSGACYAYENGRRHLKYSKIAGKEKDFGFAVSHVVLGVEELIKGLILICSHGDRYFLSTEEKQKIFTHHNFKHFNIKQFFTALSAQEVEEYHEHPFSSINNKFQSTAHFLSKGLRLDTLDEDEVDNLIELMNSANQLKNRGFYVDYGADWVIPEGIGVELYSKYAKTGEILLKYVEPIFTLPVTDERLNTFLEGRWV
jgi:AbiV family abortive infection protein